MMKVTIQDVIAFLPFDESYRKEIREKLETADFPTRLSMKDQLWDTYYALCDMYFQKNWQQAMYDVKDGKRPVGPNFYKTVREETQKEIEREMAKKTTSVGIEQVRAKLQQYMDQDK